MQKIREAFRGLILRELRPIEDKDGVRIGEDVRIHKEKDKYILRFLKGSEEKRRKQIREKLDTADVEYTEGKDYKD